LQVNSFAGGLSGLLFLCSPWFCRLGRRLPRPCLLFTKNKLVEHDHHKERNSKQNLLIITETKVSHHVTEERKLSSRASGHIQILLSSSTNQFIINFCEEVFID